MLSLNAYRKLNKKVEKWNSGLLCIFYKKSMNKLQGIKF